MRIRICFTNNESKELRDFQSATIITDSGSEVFTSSNFEKFHLKRNSEFIFSSSTETVHACTEGISFVEFKDSDF